MCFAVIIDMSEPFYSEENNNYGVKLKVIDPTFNYKAFLENPDIKFRKFATIHIFSPSQSNCPKVKFIGDIIRLRRFNVPPQP